MRPLFSKQSYDKHVKSHSELNDVCAEAGCGWAFQNFRELHKHYSDKHKLFVTKTKQGKVLNLGSSEMENGDRRNCSICGRLFKGKFDDKHVRYHNEIKFRCLEQDCGWMYETFQAFKSHYLKNHGLYLHEEAEKEYLDRKQIKLTTSPDNEESEDMYTNCCICARRLSKQRCPHHVKNHRKMTHMYKCPERDCGWMFENYDTMKGHCCSRHELNVSDEKTVYLVATEKSSSVQVDCRICGRPMHEPEYTEHMKNHDSLRYRCQESKCQWRYETFSALRHHYITKHGLKVFSEERQKHVADELRTKKCSICGRIFGPCSLRDKHIRNHDKAVYKCKEPGCGWMYEMMSGLRVHQRKVHKLFVNKRST